MVGLLQDLYLSILFSKNNKKLLGAEKQTGYTGGSAGLAQLVELLICNQRVGGSSPSSGTISSNLFREFQIINKIKRKPII